MSEKKISTKWTAISLSVAGAWGVAQAQELNVPVFEGGIVGPRSVPEFHQVASGDTLWDVAQKYFGDPYVWPKLWALNPEVTNPHWIYPSLRIRLHEPGTGGERVTGQNYGGAFSRGMRAGSLRSGQMVYLEEGWLDSEAVEKSGVLHSSSEEKVMLSTTDEVFVRFDRREEFQGPGIYSVYRPINEDERARGEKGQLVRIMGTVRLDSFDERSNLARGTVLESIEGLERGFLVSKMPRELRVSDRVPNAVDLETKVVATQRSTVMSASQQVIHLPVGSDDGLKLGNTIQVYRQQDVWRQQMPRDARGMGALYEAPEHQGVYPLQVYATGRVITIRPHTVGVLILEASREVDLEDTVRIAKE